MHLAGAACLLQEAKVSVPLSSLVLCLELDMQNLTLSFVAHSVFSEVLPVHSALGYLQRGNFHEKDFYVSSEIPW